MRSVYELTQAPFSVLIWSGSNLDEWPKTSLRMANLILRYGPIPAFRAYLAKLLSQMNFVG
jgi:hypothetical protein